MAGPQAGGTWAAFKARDGYQESLPISLVQGAPEILVAYELDGAPLPMGHGFPARMLIPGHYGMKGPKWLDSITVVDHESGGYWEQQGWDHNAVVKTTARFDVPTKATSSSSGPFQSPASRSPAREGSPRSSTAPTAADLEPKPLPAAALASDLGALEADWTPGAEGAYNLRCARPTAAGALQTAQAAPSYPSGASGYHTIHVPVSGS